MTAWEHATPIVALDVGTLNDALHLARQIGDRCRFYKVGSELYTAAGPAVVRALQDEFNADVFLDLKLHDIPATVAGAVRAARSLTVRLLTVHLAGGSAMLDAAQQAAGSEIGLLGVTVLTSMEADTLAGVWGRSVESVEAEVVRLAGLASEAGLHGVVCSGWESRRVLDSYGDRLATLVPGLRMQGGASHDQRRTATPAEAQAAGARYLVVGRAVTGAADPAQAFGAVVESLG